MKSMEWWIFLKWEGCSNVKKKKLFQISPVTCFLASHDHDAFGCHGMSWDISQLNHWAIGHLHFPVKALEMRTDKTCYSSTSPPGLTSFP